MAAYDVLTPEWFTNIVDITCADSAVSISIVPVSDCDVYRTALMEPLCLQIKVSTLS
mgnify:CR=1 FL=1